MHFSNPDSAEMVLNFVGALYLTPFLGGFAADAYLGRFWAITVFATIQVVVSYLVACRFVPVECDLCSQHHRIVFGSYNVDVV